MIAERKQKTRLCKLYAFNLHFDALWFVLELNLAVVSLVSNVFDVSFVCLSYWWLRLHRPATHIYLAV